MAIHLIYSALHTLESTLTTISNTFQSKDIAVIMTPIATLYLIENNPQHHKMNLYYLEENAALVALETQRLIPRITTCTLAQLITQHQPCITWPES